MKINKEPGGEQTESVGTILERARQALPPTIDARPEHIIIARTPRRELRAAIHQTELAAAQARMEYDAQGLRLSDATQRYLDITSPGELLQATDRTSGARHKLEQATSGYRETWQQHSARQSELDLAQRTVREARRLGRIPQAIIAVSTSAVFGGILFGGIQTAYENGQKGLASGQIRPGTPRYRYLENSGLGNRTSTDIIEGFVGTGAAVTGVAPWLLVGDRLARPRARVTVARAKKKAS